jgi:hypothetical protein
VWGAGVCVARTIRERVKKKNVGLASEHAASPPVDQKGQVVSGRVWDVPVERSGMCSARSGTVGFLGWTGTYVRTYTSVFDGTGTTKIMISGTFFGECALALSVMNDVVGSIALSI